MIDSINESKFDDQINLNKVCEILDHWEKNFEGDIVRLKEKVKNFDEKNPQYNEIAFGLKVNLNCFCLFFRFWKQMCY